MMNWLSDKLWVKSIFIDKLGIDSSKILFVPHHLSHAAASFYPSPFKSAAILTVDGVGEWTTTAFGFGRDNVITLQKEMKFPHSLGLLYSAFTAFLGFEVNDGEYKVMGMAPYGKPVYLDKVKKLVKTFADGSYALNMEYFAFHTSTDISYTTKFVSLFGKPRPRDLHFFTKTSGFPSYFGGKPPNYVALCRQNQYYADVAASIQAFTEEQLLSIARYVHGQTKEENLCVGGGVALNSVANAVLLQKGPFKSIYIQPAAGDDGGALGAALYAYHALCGNTKRSGQNTAYFGIGYTNDQIKSVLDTRQIPYRKIASESALTKYIARELAAKKVVGFFHGRAEWGPRALGARSIIANPMSEEMKDIVNVRIKFREPYRPFAPVTLASKAKEYFELGKKDSTHLTDFMLGVFPVKTAKKSKVPAITHIDGSARPQLITRAQNARYYDIVNAFGKITGVYVLMNTSFNLKGEPIVNSPENALSTFSKSGLDILVLENYIIQKLSLIHI